MLVKNHRHVKSGDDEEQLHRYKGANKDYGLAGSPRTERKANGQPQRKEPQYSEITHFDDSSPGDAAGPYPPAPSLQNSLSLENVIAVVRPFLLKA